eukprot:4063153-Pleurochrysis_carterae.AAC.2
MVSSVGHDMARHSMPTAYAMSGRWEVGTCGCVVALEGGGHAFGQVSVDKLRNIVFLLEEYTVRVSGYVHVEKIRHRALVLHVPAGRQIGSERRVQRVRRVVRVEDEQVIDVASDDDRLRYSANDGFGACEDTRVRRALLETPGLEPRE